MKSTSISIEFIVNDLSANYEIIGTSDNYSFQHKIGKGSSLVDSIGESAIQIIPLRGNYGQFEIKLFAVSDIGIRSSFVTSFITVDPPIFDGTFTFNNLRISDLKGAVQDSFFVNKYPSATENKLTALQQFQGKDVEISWELIPPSGHAREGQSLSTELLSDTLLSGFMVNIITDGQVINASSYSGENLAIQSLSKQFNTTTGDVAENLQGFRDFSLILDRDVFDGFSLSRNIGLEVVAVDNFGSTATGDISGSNIEPSFSTFISSLNGSDMSFSWDITQQDYSGVVIDVIAIPADRELFDSGNLNANINFFNDLNSAIYEEISWDENFNYSSGDFVSVSGSGFQANIDHTGTYANSPQSDSANWTNYGEFIDFSFKRETVGDSTFNQEQFFGYKYYYTFELFDSFGASDVMLLSEEGSLSPQGESGSFLFPYQSELKIKNLRYLERKDDLVFNWDIVDQDDNLIDLIQYRLAFKNGELPAILGLSGSLYDINTDQILTGLTEGNNSISLSEDENFETSTTFGLPTAKLFETFEYTRNLNNSIYSTGGFPSNYEALNYSGSYISGDHVVDSSNNVYKNMIDTSFRDPLIQPFYDDWSKKLNYISGESFIYGAFLYQANQEFGPRYTDGLFDFSKTYYSGDLVISPNQYYENFNSGSGYAFNDLVVYNSTLYRSLQNQESGYSVTPGSDHTKWKITSLFNGVDCDVYKALDSSSGLIPVNLQIYESGVFVDKWEISTPETFSGSQNYIQTYSQQISEWTSGQDFFTGDFVVYSNDIWSGVQNSGPNQGSGSITPGTDSQFWTDQTGGQDIIFSYNSGDLVYSNGTVYKAGSDNPVGAPIVAINEPGKESQSTYEGTEWIPYWQQEVQYQDTVFGHAGIPQSGKRSVGIELAIVDREGDIFNYQKLNAENPPPVILSSGFDVDSISEASKVKFNFNYDLGFQEKTTKVYLYRSENPVFDIIDEDGYLLTGTGTAFVKSVIGAGDSTFGQNITQIIDEPPIPRINGVDKITGYYYKILPFDDFGSGELYSANDNMGDLEKVIVYPTRYNSPNPNSVPGRVLRADPTDSEGSVPGTIVDFSGSTAFENFFLNWKAPGSEYETGVNTLLREKENDIDHYEVWAWTGSILYTGDSQGSISPFSQADNNNGHRKINGAAYSTGIIPTESIDPALNIFGARNIFDVSANSPSLEAVYPGTTSKNENFWIRAVDFAGNKSPFTGSLINDNDNISGLSLTPGLASATDVADFEIGMTEKFGNSIALIPPNPFSDDVGSISWVDHVLYFRGTGYFINGSNTNSGYVWWDVSENPNQSNYEYQGLRDIKYSGDYKLSDAHPQGGYNASNEYISGLDGFKDIDFIIARNNNGTSSLAFSSFPNALIGTANIAEAAIVSAKINDLSADKITSSKITSADIEISTSGSEAGVIRSSGFTGIDSNQNRSGFYISGDGTFAFQGGGSSLSLEDDTLTLRGKLRQTNGFDYDFVDLNVSPSYFNYIEARGYEAGTAGVDTFIPDDNSPTSIEIISTFRNSSVTQTGVRFRMDVLSGDNRRPVFGYDEFTGNGQYNVSGFEYNPSNFIDDSNNSSTKIASGSFALGKRLDSTAQLNGFDYLIDEAFPGSGLADSIVLYVSGLYSTYERSFTITRINDGRFGDPGVTPTYRGPWNNTNIYNFTPSTIDNPGRGDIVSFGQNHADRTPTDLINSNYFIANQDNFSGQKPIVSGSVNSLYWSQFGSELENVATDLLLTKDAFITEKLTMGVNSGPADIPHSGIIVSEGFTGGLLDVNTLPYQELDSLTENYDTPGFLLARKDGGVVFDVGGTGKAGQTGYIRFNSHTGKLEIAGSFINNTVYDESLLYTGNFASFQEADNLTSFIGGGYNNTLSTEPGGNYKYFENLGSAILGGAWNTMDSRFSAIAGGYSGYLADNFSFIGAGYGNSMPLEEPGDHQGANFIGGGIENVISGGASQSILNGIENKINQTEGKYLNNESVKFDEDQGWLSSRFLGDQLTAQFIANQTGMVSGVIFPSVENSDWGENASGYWQNELNVGHLEGINEGGWVEYSGLGWFYMNEPNVSDIYSDSNWNLGWVFSHTYRTWMYWVGEYDDEKHHLIALSTTGWFEMRMNRSNPSSPYVQVTLQDSGNWDSWGNPIT